MVTNISTYLQLFLLVCNTGIMLFAFKQFLMKPHDSLEERVAVLEAELKTMKESLSKGNIRFEQQDKTNEVLIKSTFALLEFEVHYCETEQKPISKNLEKAKDDLHDYLAQKKMI